MRRLLVLALAAPIALSEPPVASAHNRIVHMDMVDLAYQTMVLLQDPAQLIVSVEGQPIIDETYYLPDDISQAQWSAFVARMLSSAGKLDQLEADLPPPNSLVCGNPMVLTNLNLQSPDWGRGYPITSVPHALEAGYVTGSGCGIRQSWRPGGVFNTAGHDSKTGVTLGFWAGSVDDEIGDTHLWHRPTSFGVNGRAKQIIDDAIDIGLTVVLVPFVCAWDCIWNSCDMCADRAANLAEDANVLDDLEGLIPGFGDWCGSDFTGMWHHMNLTPNRSNEFDDNQGLLIEQGGLNGVPGLLDIGIMVAGDLSGLSLNYGDSSGPKRYERTNANDGMKNSERRNQGQWQFPTISSLPFSPLDNLADFGWEAFRTEEHRPRYLGWPLHALGDATAPQHVIGAVGWGHRPAEDAFEILWWQVRYMDRAFVDPTPAQAQLQRAQLFRIMIQAYRELKRIDAWRAAASGRDNDVPVRQMVTELGQRTYDYSTQKQQEALPPAPVPAKCLLGDLANNPVTRRWPYNDGSSLAYLYDKDCAMIPYLERPDAADLARPLFEDGVASMVAFLTATGDTL